MTMRYSVTVNNWGKRGWRVRCFGMPDNDWNALGRTVYENFHRTEASARAKAVELVEQWNATLLS